jgi:hypothetical protein
MNSRACFTADSSFTAAPLSQGVVVYNAHPCFEPPSLRANPPPGNCRPFQPPWKDDRGGRCRNTDSSRASETNPLSFLGKEMHMTTTTRPARKPTRNARPSPNGSSGKDDLKKLEAYWRAANYLSVGQIYLLDNPLLRKPLKREHIKPRLLGHWGTTPGLNFVYVHLNRVIKAHDLSVVYIAGPGHGGPALVANVYLEERTRRSIPRSPRTKRG